MNNGVSIPDRPAQASISAPRGPAREQALSGYDASREVGNRARVTATMNDPEFKQAVSRLNRDLASGQPLCHDVPRGYYLNVTV